ncbi:tyrosine-type recombinase/integrase [Cupriavidus basilensis]
MADLLHRNLREETARKKGAEAEVNHTHSILKYPLARVHLVNLTRRDIKEWTEQRLQHVAPSTVNRELNILNAVFKLAVHEWDVALCKSVLITVRRPKNPSGRVRRLSREEEVALRRAGVETRNPYIVSILDLALETAMRRSEILSLEWERVSFTHRSIRLIETKNGTPRGVPLSRRATEVLISLRRVAAHELGGAGELDSGPVFPGLTVNAFKLAFTRMVKRAGLEKLPVPRSAPRGYQPSVREGSVTNGSGDNHGPQGHTNAGSVHAPASQGLGSEAGHLVQMERGCAGAVPRLPQRLRRALGRQEPQQRRCRSP